MAQEREHVQHTPVAQPQVPAPPMHQNQQAEQEEATEAAAIAEVFVAPPPSLDNQTFVNSEAIVNSYNTEGGE